MKHTNKVIRRTLSIALSALMIMSAAFATLCTANATTIDEVALNNRTGKVQRMDELTIHDGRVYEPGTSNWFAVRNTSDGNKTYITASDEDGQTTIKVLDGNSEIVAFVTEDLATTDMMKVEIPMNEDDGVFYYVNVYQNPETASTENYSVNHLSQGYINLIEATAVEFNSTVTIETQPAAIENMDGTAKSINEAKETLYIATGADTSYVFEIGADSDLEYSFVVTDFDGNYVADFQGTVKGGSADVKSVNLEENGSYFVYFCGNSAEAGEVTFGFVG